MAHNPFTPVFAKLPEALPIFPLPGAIVLPGTEMPLNIFEPRYLNMVFDVLGTHRTIGMVQPRTDAASESVAVYRTGCAGRITSFRETNDGRVILVLSGICRFDIASELPTTRGYRMAVPDWQRFAVDYDDDAPPLKDSGTFLSTLKDYLKLNELDADWKSLQKAPANRLVNTLTTVLPLEPTDKQAMLETVTVDDQIRLMEGLFKMSAASPASIGKH